MGRGSSATRWTSGCTSRISANSTGPRCAGARPRTAESIDRPASGALRVLRAALFLVCDLGEHGGECGAVGSAHSKRVAELGKRHVRLDGDELLAEQHRVPRFGERLARALLLDVHDAAEQILDAPELPD